MHTRKNKVCGKSRSTVAAKRETGLLLTIDPGVSRTGFALWDLADWDKITYPVSCGILTPGTTGSWEDRACGITHNLRELTSPDKKLMAVKSIEDLENVKLIRKAIIEEPKYFADSAMGDMTAKTNSLGKLYMLVGLFMGVLWENNIEVELIRVDKWKSTLPKNVVIQRIRRRLPEIDQRLAPKADAWDSIGIGLGVRGYLSMRT